MRVEKFRRGKRVLAALLVWSMVLSLAPVNTWAYAAADEPVGAVTITVVDAHGQPIPDATVAVSVDSVCQGEDYISQTKETDEYGTVEVMPASDFVANDMWLSAKVTAAGYEQGALEETQITAADQDFQVTLAREAGPEVTITGRTVTYNGTAQELVWVTKPEGSTVAYEAVGNTSYELNGEGQPVAVDAGTYIIKVTVHSANTGADYVRFVKTVISPADIAGISIQGKNLTYDGQQQDLVTLTGGLQDNDVLTWIVNGEEQAEFPREMAVGTYNVTLQVDRGPNYNTLVTEEVTTVLGEGALGLDGLTITALNSVYTINEQGEPVAQPVVTVEQTGNYTLMYQLDDGTQQINGAAWTSEIPTVTDAGSYCVWVKVTQEAGNDGGMEGVPTEGVVLPYYVHIAKADQSLQFNIWQDHTSKDEPKTIPMSGPGPYENVTYDFSATDITALAGGTITYQVECEEGVGSMDANGILTIYDPGDITVIATLSGNENYKQCQIEYYLKVYAEASNPGEFIQFPNHEVDYTLSKKNPFPSQAAEGNGAILQEGVKYSFSDSSMTGAFSIDEACGVIKVKNYDVLAEKMRGAGGTLEVQVNATKEAGDLYGEDHATYTVYVSFEPTPAETCTYPEPEGKDGWYTTAVTVTLVGDYAISKLLSQDFGESVVFNDQGETVRYVYLENEATGGITDRIKLDIEKIDTFAPCTNNMWIEITGLNILEKIKGWFGFANPPVAPVTIRFYVKDELVENESGLDYVEWFYTNDDDGTSWIPDGENNRLEVNKEGEAYVATLTLAGNQEKQFSGYITFVAWDKAGNNSDPVGFTVNEDGEADKDGEEVRVVVDTVSPTVEASFGPVDENGVHNTEERDGVVQHYFDGDVKYTVKIKEANFFEEDVVIAAKKDGEDYPVRVDWTQDETDDEIHYGKFTLSGDGDYVVTMSYEDQSGNTMVDHQGNEMDSYTSEVITIDTIDPIISFEYYHNKEVQKTIFTVKERNFWPEHIEVAENSTMQDVNGEPVWTAEELTEILQNAEWVQGEDDTYTFEYDGYVDGIYNLTLNYMDYSGRAAKSFTGEQFIIDHEGPTDVKIEYIKPPLEQFLETITLGFYKASVIVQFTAKDANAGVATFTWEYTKEEGASTINHPDSLKERTIDTIKQDPNDKSMYTAKMTLTAEEDKQYRGYISVVATDAFGTPSDKLVDAGNIIVVDNVAPELTVEYTPADRTVANTSYYNNDVEVKFIVTEANFFAEDVELTVTKDGEVFDYGAVEWGDRDNDDNTVGTLILPAPEDHSGDGEYVIEVNYQDRSENGPVHYQSDVIVIDTVAPEVKVEYQNRSPVNTLKDGAGHDRQYFADTQTAVVTITERNLNLADVNYNIIAQDVAGNPLDLAQLVSMSEWRSQGDVHTMTITYPGDANYTFDVACTDLATNEAADYSPDYFTVDQTAPTNLRVAYSTSILDTILESVSFGFYNAKMTVTISADDTVSGVHAFAYSYRNAQGVSSVNAQLLNQAIAAADIRYSEDGVTASASFDIPKMLLGGDNQFNGVVEFTATNRSGTESEVHRETKRIVVDNISPTAQVTYNAPVNSEGDVAYYDGNIEGTISIREANFYAQDVRVSVSKDGGEAVTVPTTWSDQSVDDHVGTFTLREDGDYIVTIQYRDKSSNQMQTYTSQQMTIDTQLEDPTFSVNGQSVGENGGSYKGEAEIAFAFEDVNFATQSMRLVRTRYDAVEEVTDEFVQLSNTETGGAGSFTIPAEAENDGIYTFTVEVTDKAMHTVQAQMKFTINRFGSVYQYDDTLMGLIKDGGQYVTIQDGENTAITEDLVITEYNANPLLDGSQSLLITRDGESVDAAYAIQSTNTDEAASTDQGGWYQYVYVIDPSNFEEDGVYKIALSSGYATTDSEENISTSVPENSMDSSGAQVTDTMTFTVDTTAPEIRNIVNLEQEIINASAVDVKYTVVDVGGLKSVEVLVDDQTVDSVTQFDGDGFQYNGQFTIYESSKTQNVRLKVTDLAGNVTDTAAEDFNANELFEFHDKVTVSTNFFVRWYANKLAFWSTIGGAVLIVGVLVFVLVAVRRKREAYQ